MYIVPKHSSKQPSKQDRVGEIRPFSFMKIRMKSMAFTPYGALEKGQILESNKYPEEFLTHLVEDANAADRIDYETKVDDAIEVKKKTLSSQSLPPAKASRKPTATSRSKKPKSSR